jgi:orotate phosphoribosyltransferase
MTFDLLTALLDTQALRLAPPGEVFWYTSGTVGPYYINTEYLYGGPKQAKQLLSFIDEHKKDADFPQGLQERVEKQYAENVAYRQVVDELVVLTRESGAHFNSVSGGERRDWFFSLAVAERLGKPALLIYKDGRTVALDGQKLRPVNPNDMDVLHVADLVTEASSYVRDWIPAVAAGGGRIAYAANVIDRGQGGLETLKERGVAAGALMRIDDALFDRLRAMGQIDAAQRAALVEYYRAPHAAMRTFLAEHPEFVRRALHGNDARAAQRARLLIAENLYGLDAALWRD